MKFSFDFKKRKVKRDFFLQTSQTPLYIGKDPLILAQTPLYWRTTVIYVYLCGPIHSSNTILVKLSR